MAIADTELSGIILCNMVKNNHYAEKIAPYIMEEFFADGTERQIAKTIISLNQQYGKCPTVVELVATMRNLPNINSLDKNVINDVMGDGFNVNNTEWLINETEMWVRRRRVSLAFEHTYRQFEEGGIDDSMVNVFQEALSFHFDNSIGHSLLQDAGLRWEMYTTDEARMSLGYELLDLITGGGLPAGTLNCFLAGTGVGKSFVMACIAAKAAMAGKKVLVISLEMAEIRLAERIECNLMDVELKSMKKMSKADFSNRQAAYIKTIKDNGGDIIFKQYPTKAANAGHFRSLLIEAKNKMGYEFDLIVIDYLNICGSMRAPAGANSYSEIKSIAEELRGLAVEFGLPIVTATQTNKAGQDATELSIDNVSESHGLAATVDLLLAIISNPEWEKMGKLMFMQLKNRYGDTSYYRKLMIGINRNKMQMYDISKEASDELNNGPQQAEAVMPDQIIAGFDMSVLGNTSPPSLDGLLTGTDKE